MTNLITEARELCERATTGNGFSQKFAEIKRIINDVRTESEKLARTKQCYTCALGNQDETGTYCENAADDYDCEDEGCSNFVDGSVSYAKIAEDDLHTVLEALPELVDALEKAQTRGKGCEHCRGWDKRCGASFCPNCGAKMEDKPFYCANGAKMESEGST